MATLVRIDPGSEAPLHQQVADSLKQSIADGDLEPGDRLPAAKELAETLDLNVHTVLHAYRVLSEEGLVEIRRGRGATRVARGGTASTLLDRAIEEAKRAGTSRADFVKLVKGRWG